MLNWDPYAMAQMVPHWAHDRISVASVTDHHAIITLLDTHDPCARPASL